nr:putative ribonuclease H-like domain-containing protein [Tanacetum cinerariifolium]
PPTVFTQTKPISFTVVSPVSAVVPKINVTRPKHFHLVVTKSKSPIRSHITCNPSLKTSNLPPRVTAAKALVVSAAQGNPQHALKDKREIDSGCSRHMTGNMSYLSDFEELNGGYVAFGGNPKGGRIFGKGKIKTGTGPIWLFNIDTLTKSMNYQQVTAGNQSNPSAGVQEQFDAEKVGEENVQQYVLFPLWSSGSKNPQNTDDDAAFGGKKPEFEGEKPESEHLSPSSIARIEAIRLFLAYASFMGFMVYQMDVKSAFLYGTIKEEVYVCIPLGFEDPDYPDKVYKVVKALYGLNQAPRAWYETLVNYLLENGFQKGKIDQTLFIKRKIGDILLVQMYVDDIIFDGKSASTPIYTKKPLLKDPDGEDVDVHTYRSMIGSLMYLTSLRPDIRVVGNKMHKAFALPGIEFSLGEKVPTASEEGCHCQKKREATARKIALLSKSRRNCQSKSNDSLTKLVPHVTSYSYEVPTSTASATTTDTTSGETGKKSGRTVTLTAEDMQKKKNDYKTARELWAAILKTFGGNETTKKTKKNLLKQQYGNFKAEGSETLEQTFNRLQVIVGQLQFMDVEIEQDDLNQKFLTSLAREWLMHTIVWRNMSDLDTMSLDDLYNHLKVYESEVQKKTELNSQNMAFISSVKHISGNKDGNTASTNVPTASAIIATISQDTACAYITSQSSGSQIKFEDINQIDEDDMEEMDIKWNMALLSMRADKFWKRTGKKISIQGLDVAGFDKSKVERRGVDGKLAGLLTASKDLDNLIESQTADKNKEGLRYSVVPPPPAQIYSSPKKDLSCTGLPKFANDTKSFCFETVASPITPKPFIKFVKPKGSQSKNKTDETETPKKPPVKYAEQYRKPNKKPNVRGNLRNWNNLKSQQLGPDFVMKKKACFNYEDFNHLAYDCRKRVKKSFTPKPVAHRPDRPPVRPVRTNMNDARPNITSFNKQAHSYANRPFHRISIGRSHYRTPWVPTVNRNFPSVNRKFSTGSRNFPTANRKFLTASRKFLAGSSKCSTVDMGMNRKAVKPSACWFWKPSQNLSNKGNISYLSDYEPFDGGYVSFGQGGCKITGKGTIKTGKLEFENVYFMKDLKYNLFSVSQICDNKNSVLFTDSEKSVHNVNFHPMVDFIEASPLRQYTRRARIAQSSALPTKADEPGSPLRDISQGEARPTDSGFIADQDRATITKSSTLPNDSALRVTSPAAAEGTEEIEITRLKARLKLLEDRQGVVAEGSGDDAPIKGRSLDEGETTAKRASDDTDEMETVLTSMNAATVLARGAVEVPTGSGSIPTTGPPAAEVPTGIDVVPTASLVFATATVVTPYRRRKGKEVMVESDTPKKQKVQEQIDAQVAREMEEQLEREDQRRSEQIARDAEIVRIHAEEELQIMIDGLDRNNETVAKYLQDYHQFASELPIERRIELISDLVKYQDNYAKIYKFQSQQRKPLTKKQKRDYYKAVIRSKLGWKVKGFRGLTFKEVEAKFNSESAKKQKTSEEVTKVAKSPDEVPEEKVKDMMQLVPIEEVYVEALQVKHPIIY